MDGLLCTCIASVLIHFISTVPAENDAKIHYVSDNKMSYPGEKVKLDCRVEYAPGTVATWVKVDLEKKSKDVIAIENSIFASDDRYTVNFDHATDTYSLMIDDVKKSDSGKYGCEILSTSDGFRETFGRFMDLQVLSEKPNNTRLVTATPGDTVKLKCPAPAEQTQVIRWIRENNASLPNGARIENGNEGSVLLIPRINVNDSGIYYCIAYQRGISEIKKEIKVNVEYPPDVSFDRLRYKQTLLKKAVLKCRASGNPLPVVEWLRNGKSLKANDEYISSTSTTDDYVEVTLKVLRTKKRHLGSYSCKATNKWGSSEKFVNVYENTSPNRQNNKCTMDCLADTQQLPAREQFQSLSDALNSDEPEEQEDENMSNAENTQETTVGSPSLYRSFLNSFLLPEEIETNEK